MWIARCIHGAPTERVSTSRTVLHRALSTGVSLNLLRYRSNSKNGQWWQAPRELFFFAKGERA